MLITAEILNEMIATKFPSATCTTKKLYAISDTSKLAKKLDYHGTTFYAEKEGGPPHEGEEIVGIIASIEYKGMTFFVARANDDKYSIQLYKRNEAYAEVLDFNCMHVPTDKLLVTLEEFIKEREVLIDSIK